MYIIFCDLSSVCYLTSTHNSFGGPAARFKWKGEARTPRAPAGDFVLCTPSYEWISVTHVDKTTYRRVYSLQRLVYK